MKKIILLICLSILTLNSLPVHANESAKKEEIVLAENFNSKEKKLSKKEAKVLVHRLKEIRDMDKSEMTLEEKQALRKEVVDIKEKLKKSGGAFLYLSWTAIIIILLLIILI